ncbi:MAG: 2-C-methyl-D-erythritol 4-phosphate cytidylyltransferase [Lachnospiraceae bacterium]|nr:2-C-methyl-D-erythritol 4-phosphate cytidylyltransferase [Lachnospiraceae bacterium]
MYYTAIVLAAGRGSRMNSGVRKQYMQIAGRPVLFYALRAFEDSFVDEIILVTAEEEIAYCKKEIVEAYGFRKVSRIVAGGKERYHSVYRGLCAARAEGCVLIHDGARPFLTEEILARARENLRSHAACVAAVPSKDTVKIADRDGYVKEPPDRASVWNMQTPQCFTYELAMQAYQKLMESEEALKERQIAVTDDAMVVEYFSKERVKLFEGSYYNIKITTPEDMELAEVYLKAVQTCRYRIKLMESEEEIKGKAYVHYKSWHETYTGLVDAEYLKSITLEGCTEIAYKWPDNIIVSKDGDKVIGFVGCGAYRDGTLPDHGEIFSIYVLEEYHGKKVGYELMNAAFEKLADYKKIAVWVLKGNDRAIRFYERYGFQCDGAETEIILGVPNTELRMIYERK